MDKRELAGKILEILELEENCLLKLKEIDIDNIIAEIKKSKENIIVLKAQLPEHTNGFTYNFKDCRVIVINQNNLKDVI